MLRGMMFLMNRPKPRHFVTSAMIAVESQIHNDEPGENSDGKCDGVIATG
jgi:hypothetical protein